MNVYRTPSERFDGLPEFPYETNYTDVGSGRMAYVDFGSGPETFLLLHGEPTWSFLYRKLIPILAERGRVIVPDLLGFGRSDKFLDPAAYTVELHYESLVSFLDTLELESITMVGQDWGGILGLRAAGEHPGRFARLVPMNTGLPDGTQDLPEEWHEFARMVATADKLDIGRLVDAGCATSLSPEVRAAYDAPFPDEASKTGARRFPELVPQSPDDEGAEAFAAALDALSSWEKPAFVLFGDSDPIFRDTRDQLRDIIPTAADQPDVWVRGAGHFLQEDAGERVAKEIVGFVDRTPLER